MSKSNVQNADRPGAHAKDLAQCDKVTKRVGFVRVPATTTTTLYTMLHPAALHYIARHYTTLHEVHWTPLQYTTPHSSTVHYAKYISLHYTMPHYTTTRQTTLTTKTATTTTTQRCSTLPSLITPAHMQVQLL